MISFNDSVAVISYKSFLIQLMARVVSPTHCTALENSDSQNSSTKFQISLRTKVIFLSGKFLAISNNYRGSGKLS